jgi:uncharacterized membrane protein
MSDESKTGSRSSVTWQKRAARLSKFVLLLLLTVSLIGVLYVAVNPPQSTDPYTEFYLLGPEGNASDYPTQLQPGESGTVIVGVTNHEGQPTTYEIRVVDMNTSDNKTLATASQTIQPGETWERSVTFSLEQPGRHRIQFQLYKDDIREEPYLTTRLWINVTNEEQPSKLTLSEIGATNESG